MKSTLYITALDKISKENEIYKNTLKKHFTFLKQTTSLDDLYSKSIQIQNNQGFLLPLCTLHLDDFILIKKLAAWRHEHSIAYPSQFPITLQGTEKWLKTKIIHVQDRLLFLLVDKYGHTIGHLGLSNALNDTREIEIDNVLRGIENTFPGIMTQAMKTLLKWTEEIIQPRSICLRVLDDNHHAIKFYQRLGFQPDKLLPLRKHQQGDHTFYRDLEKGDALPPDKNFLRMVFSTTYQVDKSETILTAGPSISARETSYVLDATRRGWNKNCNNYTIRFEQAFAEYLGIQHALTTSSCTGALHISLVALGVGPGDEVVVPDLTWVATANAVLYTGATPVFADVELDSWCLDPDSFENAITERTKAVIPVHLYGHPAKMDRIVDIARRHGIYVIEDAAPAIGAEMNGQKAGTFGDVAAFSFQGAKLAVTGEGGMIVTSNSDLFSKIHCIWNQGRLPGTFWIQQNGLKYKISNLQSAIGLAQIERIEGLIQAKRRIFSTYEEHLSRIPNAYLHYEMPWAHSVYWMTSLYLKESACITRDAFREELTKRNIDTRPVFPAISQYPIWPSQQYPKQNSLRIGNQAINLPSGVSLRKEQIQYICDSILEILTANT